MKRISKQIGLLLVIMLLIGSGGAAAQSMDPNALRSLQGEDFDIAFMRDVITNRQIDIELLRPAASNASHREIKELALRLIDERQQQADQLIGWLNDWYHNQPNTSMTATLIHMQAMPSMDMASLNEALQQIAAVKTAQGNDYDRLVLRYMIRDHQLSLDSTALVASRAARPELKSYAAQLANSLQADMAQYSGWLRDWYQLDNNGQPLPPTATSPPATATMVSLPLATATPLIAENGSASPATTSLATTNTGGESAGWLLLVVIVVIALLALALLFVAGRQH